MARPPLRPLHRTAAQKAAGQDAWTSRTRARWRLPIRSKPVLIVPNSSGARSIELPGRKWESRADYRLIKVVELYDTGSPYACL